MPFKKFIQKPTNYYWFKVIGWNARSVKNKTRNEFMWHLVSEHKPDIMIVVETWMGERIPILNTRYKVQQTFNNNYQGICIIAKREFEMKIESDDCQSSWILVLSIRSNGEICAYNSSI